MCPTKLSREELMFSCILQMKLHLYQPGKEVEECVNIFFRLLEIYYNSQKLKINADKTPILVCSMPRFFIQIKEMEIKTPADMDNVKPQEQIKV